LCADLLAITKLGIAAWDPEEGHKEKTSYSFAVNSDYIPIVLFSDDLSGEVAVLCCCETKHNSFPFMLIYLCAATMRRPWLVSVVFLSLLQ